MYKANVVSERFYFLFLHGGGALCDRSLENGFGSGFAFFDGHVPGAGLGCFVFLFTRVKPGVGDFGNRELALLFGVKENADVLGGNHLVADNFLVEFVFRGGGAEFAKVGKLGVGYGSWQAVSLDIDGEGHRLADLEFGAIEISAKAVVTYHATKVCWFSFGGERLYGDVDNGGLCFRFYGFLLDAPAREGHTAHLLTFFDNLGLAALGVLELERRNLQVAAFGGAQPGELGAGLHFAAVSCGVR